MENKDLIELHRKYRKRIKRVSIRKDQILMVDETKRGTFISFLLHADFESFATVRCIESYDDVMALINK
ncbi:MAG: hypothetical protein K2L54_02245 [Clostridiales bacterium]|nr:hypothetical protein [Clostridiales bacterium]